MSAQFDSSRTFPYPIHDRYGDPFTWRSYNAFDMDTALLKRNIVYDSATHSYFIVEKIDTGFYRYPINISQYDFLHLQGMNDEYDYYNSLSNSVSMLNQKQPRPKPKMYKTLFNRIFGLTPDGKKMDVSATGNIDLQMGYQGQNTENPLLSEQARKTGSFMMNANANVSVTAQVGNKLKLPISFNSNGTYSFNNQLKLNYQGTDDEFLKSVQAGNVSFQTRGTLMTSMQNLFGVEAQLHLGKLMITGVVANDRSQKQTVTAQGGGLSQTVNMSLGNYDLNRNFLLGNYFEQHFNQFMSNLPVTNSLVRILRMEVWVTNATGATTNVRTIVGLMDLGENQPYNNHINSLNSYNGLPDNGANSLYSSLAGNAAARNPASVASILNAQGLAQSVDYEQTYARKLDSTEYTYNPQLGVLLLNSQIQPNQVLAAAYQYSYNGRVYQVGEFSSDVALDSTQGIQKVLFVKLLKGTNQVTNLPTWGWMMKNVYSLNMSGLDSSAFNLNVYYQQPSGGNVIYMPQASSSVNGRSIISILGADRLNVHRDAIPDGQFDYVPGFTVIPSQGKIIFPVLEPFGKDLASLAYSGVSQSISNQYVYYQLYDSVQAIANTYPNLNRFVLQGIVKGSSTSVISIGASNIPPGSVVVTSGGRTLTEGVDYTVQYDVGTVQIINQAILSSGTPVNVQYENNANLASAQRNFIGVRLDYNASRNLSFGATMEKLTETPYTFKTNYGDDPVNNTMYGVDASYHSDVPQLTKWLNKLPFYSSNAPSSISAFGEAAIIKPGHPSQIGQSGTVYIDDFESSSNPYDLRTPFTSWTLASTPAGNGLFPEADLSNDLNYGKNRAQLAWYSIEPTLQDATNTSNPLYKNLDALSDPRVRAVYTNELFPNQSTLSASLQTTTFDLSYYPNQKGQYNFTDDPQNIDANGNLSNPQKRWGGIMRSLDQTDFISNNIQYIEMWVQDPFIKAPNSLGGKLMIDLGNISEDVLKDGKHEYENGLSTPNTPSAVDSSSVWGTVPANPIQLINGFSNNPADRPYQDVGFDGLADQDERRKRAEYLQNLANNFGINSEIYQTALNDPSADDYVWYRDSRFTSNDGILARYKHYNGTEGNSPVATTTSSASTTYPDNEDLNGDNTMNQSEQYYEYEVDLKPNMTLTDKYIADVRTIQPKLANDSITQEHWYLLRIPITDFTSQIGNIADFTSIRFMRMYLTGFQDSATIRFAELSLVRNAWRNFTYVLDTSNTYTSLPTNSATTLAITEVNTQDNSLRSPIPYKMPPGVQQQQTLQGAGSVSNGSVYLEKEQSMSLNISNLNQYDARAVIKNMNVDMRRYGQMSMFIHAESIPGQTPVNNNDLVAVIRLGQDFVQNYYEIRIPLQVTQFNESATPQQIWPDSNKMVVELQNLVNLKLQRDAQRIPYTSTYQQQFGYETYAVKGNPNIAQVTSYLIGIENANNSQPLNCDVWVDELALSQMSEKGGWAAQGRVDMQLADLGTVSVSANAYSAGFGTLEQNQEAREMNSMTQYDVSATLNIGKLFPRKLNFNIPFYASINKSVTAPQYDPYDQDVLFNEKIKSYTSYQKDSARAIADTRSTTKTFSFTNVRFGIPSRVPKLWDISNFDFSYTYTKVDESDPLTAVNNITTTSGGIGYTFNGQPKYWQPFKRVFNNKSLWLSFIRDFNINPVPSLLGFRYTFNRQSAVYTPRVVNPYNLSNNTDSLQTTYDNFFNLTRNYNLNWNLTKSLNIDFTATNLSVVDEPYGPLNTKAKRDSVWHNLLRGGRNTQYSQTATVSYNLPFNKFPMFDWITGSYSYSANYNWISANLQNVALGNVIENGNASAVNAQFNFRTLYNKSKFLKSILESKPTTQIQPQQNNNTLQQASLLKDKKTIDSLLKTIPKRWQVVKGLHGRAKRVALRRWRDLKEKINLAVKQLNAKQPQENSVAVETGIRLLTMIKSIGINYSVTNQSRLPGFMDSSKVLGNDLKSGQPGFAYIFGKMPTEQWLMKKAAQHLITEDSAFNDQYSQVYTSGLNFNAQLEPFKNLIIDITATKSFSKNYTTLFKDTLGNGSFQFLSPYSSGGFNVSYMTFKGLFEKSSTGTVSNIFQNFSNYRQIISQRLGSSNPYNTGLTGSNGYAYGYGQYAQNVLIPAFIAAYTGQSPEKVALVAESNPSIKTNPLGSFFPMPNWTLTYAGLNKIGNLSNIFANISVTNGYSGSLGMNGFTSALNFQDPLLRGEPSFIDTISGNYVPYFLIPNITISETFQPLIGISATLVNQSSFQFSYSKSRQLSLSLVDYQVSESNMTSYQAGFNIVKHNVNIPILSKLNKLQSKPQKGQQQQKNKGAGNDLSFGLTMSMTNQFTSNSTLDESGNYSTGGQKVWMFAPSINYVLNNRFTIKLFYTENKTVPYISTSPPITTTQAGLEIKMSIQ